MQVRLLGPLELELDGSRLGPRDLGGVKPKQLLELLLLERRATVAKDAMAEAVWGERPPQRVAAGRPPAARRATVVQLASL